MDDDNYTELKELSALRVGSLNALVSKQVPLRRPPSLSESCAWTPENVERAAAATLQFSPTKEVDPVFPTAPPTPPPHNTTLLYIINLILKLSFHITLISVFESLFFFFYISDLEDGGINKTIDGFVDDALHACSNFTAPERIIVNDILYVVVNTTVIQSGAAFEVAARDKNNAAYFRLSWYYVGGFGGLFVILAIVARLKRYAVEWRSLLLENLAMVTALGLYEYMFFTTVISPYSPISGLEVASNAIQKMHSTCGLFWESGKN